MPNLTISIPHQLGCTEAKRRLDELASNVQGQSAGMLQRVEQHWDGDTLHFHIGAMGQTISGTAHVTEQTVNLDIALPWMLSLLAGTVKKQIETQARDLLQHQPAK
jgi:putative polyhydroxyalkanoate system protein